MTAGDRPPSGVSRQARCVVLAAALLCGTAWAQEKPTKPPPYGIFVMNRDGSAVRRVTRVEAYPRLAAPRWSHDGQRLAFEARGNRLGRALLVDLTGRNLIDLGRGAKPDWSPDDQQVIFEVPGVGSAVWVQTAEGKGSTWVAKGAAPRWSPDGSQIAAGSPLRILDVLSGAAREVFVPHDHVEREIGWDWSPDGRRLAVVVARNKRTELLLIDVDADSGLPPRVRWRGRLDGAPAWSPDGRRLAVTIEGRQPGARRISLLTVEGNSAPQPIAGQTGDNCDPAWSPDGRRLAFASTRAR